MNREKAATYGERAPGRSEDSLKNKVQDDPLLPFYLLAGVVVITCLVTFSVVLPLRMDRAVEYSWAEVFTPLLICVFGLPVFSLLLLAILVFASLCFDVKFTRDLYHIYQDYAIAKPRFWIEVVLYLIPIGIAAVFLMNRLDRHNDVPFARIVAILVVGPLFGTLFAMFNREWRSFVINGLATIQIVAIVAHLSAGNTDNVASWFLVLIPTWIADLIGPIALVNYVIKSTHTPKHKMVTVVILMCGLVPAYVFQLLLAHRLQLGNELSWLNIFIPIFVIEGVFFGPFLILCAFMFLKCFCACILGPKDIAPSRQAAVTSAPGGSARKRVTRRTDADDFGDEHDALVPGP